MRSDVDDDALDILPDESRERYPPGVEVDDMRFMSDGGVRAGRIGIWKCRACGADIELRCLSDEERSGSAAVGETSFDMLLKKSQTRTGAAGLDKSSQVTVALFAVVGGSWKVVDAGSKGGRKRGKVAVGGAVDIPGQKAEALSRVNVNVERAG